MYLREQPTLRATTASLEGIKPIGSESAGSLWGNTDLGWLRSQPADRMLNGNFPPLCFFLCGGWSSLLGWGYGWGLS